MRDLNNYLRLEFDIQIRSGLLPFVLIVSMNKYESSDISVVLLSKLCLIC
jgi:hypothetical protein